MLKTIVNFISQSRDGREVILRDGTGLESDGVTTGYGPTNGLPEDILAHYFVLSNIPKYNEYIVKVDGSDPLLPDNIQLANGDPISITTGLCADNGMNVPHDLFWDGVLNVDMYVEFLGLSGVVIGKGNNFVTFPPGDIRTFEDAYNGDAIIVDGIIYQIDKSIDNNAFTVLYIIGEFESDQTSLNYLYRSNTKALLTSMGEALHSYACDRMRNNIESPEWLKINTAASFRRAAYGFFTAEVPDYVKANELAFSGMKMLKKYEIC
jgi:hypothetical protein